VATFQYLSPLAVSGLLKLADAAFIVDVLRNDGLAVLPTETGYMVAAKATARGAILKAFAVKGRSLSNTMHVAFSSMEMAEPYARLTPRARRLLGALTPGPITVVVEQTDKLPDGLVTLNGTVGVRIPDHPATLQVIAALGEPVTATSLNRAGEEATPLVRDELELLGWPAAEIVGIVLVDQPTRYAQPSTLVRVIDANLEVLRKGPITEDTIAAVAHATT
jgi:L-threonylcarbamoyladenylate synthase